MRIIKTCPKHLGAYIQCFYTVDAPASGQPDTIHRRLPDGTLDLVFNLGGEVLISRNGLDFSVMPEVAVTGLYPDRCFLQYKGAVQLIGAVFQPGYAHLFVNDSLMQYKECTVEASLVFGNDIYLLQEQLRAASGDEEKHDLLELFLLRFLSRRSNYRQNPGIVNGVSQIHALDGNIELHGLYKSEYMSERNFRRLFTEYVGMSPKQYATIVRIKSFSKRYELSRLAYAGIAEDLGYGDQSHFNKDFQKIVGLAPTLYFNQLNGIGAGFIHLI